LRHARSLTALDGGLNLLSVRVHQSSKRAFEKCQLPTLHFSTDPETVWVADTLLGVRLWSGQSFAIGRALVDLE
jgi:hypothetical protein